MHFLQIVFQLLQNWAHMGCQEEVFGIDGQHSTLDPLQLDIQVLHHRHPHVVMCQHY